MLIIAIGGLFMAWENFGATPPSIDEINRTDFRYTSKAWRVFSTIGAIFLGALAGVALYLAAVIVVCTFTCGDPSKEVDDFLYFILYVAPVIGAFGFAIWKNMELNQDDERVDTERRMIMNYHLYEVKRQFYYNHARDSIEFVRAHRGTGFNNLYSYIPFFATRYCEGNPHRNLIESELEAELKRYVDSNADLIISEANRYLNSDSKGSFATARAMLNLVSGYEAADRILNILDKNAISASTKKMFMFVGNNYKVNETFINSFRNFDNLMINDLFSEEYEKFCELKGSRTPYNVINNLSVESYLSFLWYFTLTFNKKNYSLCAEILSYFTDWHEVEFELDASREYINTSISGVNHSSGKTNLVKDQKYIDAAIKRFTILANRRNEEIRQ